MKHLLLFLLAFSLAVNISFAQKKLTNSRTSGYHTYIYKLTDKETFNIAVKGNDVIDDSYLHLLVDSFYTDRKKLFDKKLPYGNYLYVNAVRNKLDYRLVHVQNVNLKLVDNRKDFQFALTDLNGVSITNAEMKSGKSGSLKYDPAAGLYRGSGPLKVNVITVKHDDISNYFRFEKDEENDYSYKPSFFRKLIDQAPLKYTWQPFKRLFNPKTYKPYQSQKPKYVGYMVFSKPMYKPLDTLKFKTYLLSTKGKDIKGKRLRVVLTDRYDTDQEKVLDSILPYRAGGYDYSFVLTDSLNLTLDKNYRISLKAYIGKQWKEVYTGTFRYEDYELKSVNFSVRADKEQHSPGNPVTLFLKATDENDLAVPDGRAEVMVRANTIDKYQDHKVFVKDTLWKTSLIMDPVGETKLVLPDSIFPAADLHFQVSFKFLNSNNESRTAYKSLNYIVSNKEIKADFKKDSLYFDYQVKGKSVKQKAMLYTRFNDITDSTAIELPAAIKIDYRQEDYEIKTADGFRRNFSMSDFEPALSVSAVQNKDSLRVLIDNEHIIPFWYTVFSGNKVILRGHANQLDTLMKHGIAKAAHVHLSYLWNGEIRHKESSTYYAPDQLNVKLLAPEIVYPGQTVNMQVNVTDINNQPVAATDLTAYGYTSKFGPAESVSLPDFGKRFPIRKLLPEIELEDIASSGSIALKWEKWGKELGLDTIQYYQFTQTKDLYAIQEDGLGDTAVMAPFVVKNGAIEPVHVIYVDGVPVYFSQADQLQRYAFKLKPGEHYISLRTALNEVRIRYTFPKGKKTILSIAADEQNKKATVTTALPKMGIGESELLEKYMIQIQDNFDEEQAVINAENRVVLLNPPPTVNRNRSLLAGPFAENYLNFKSGGLDLTFIKEPGYVYTFTPGLLKQKSYPFKYTFSQSLSTGVAGENDNYKQFPLERSELDGIWEEYLNMRSATTSLFNNRVRFSRSSGRLVMKLDSSFASKMPYVKNILIYKNNEPDFLHVYPGNAGHFFSLEEGTYRILYLFKDNRYFVADQVQIKPAGINYFEWKDFKVKVADSLSIKIDRQIKSVKNRGGSQTERDKIIENLNTAYFDKSSLKGKMSGRLIDDADKSVIVGGQIRIRGLSQVVSTDATGYFEIKVPEIGNLVISAIGYETKEIAIQNGNVGDIQLHGSSASLNEVVVIGYGTQQKKSLTVASISRIESLSSKMAGVVAGVPGNAEVSMIKGLNTLAADKKPLIFVDGLPFSGDLSTLEPGMIAGMSTLKGGEAAAIYGSAGVNGVIIIKTKTGRLNANAGAEPVSKQQTMRSNFSDAAIWQPRLITDAAGKASFSVKFPDDITNWTTRVVALNGRKQSGFLETNIKSFKTLSANFVSPQFATAGDSIRVIGKLMNYGAMEESVSRTFKYNDETLLTGAVKFKNAKIDTVAIVAFKTKRNVAADSLKFEYTMKQDNGYFDGELRRIPLLQAGVTETKGYFNSLLRDTTVTYAFDASLGKVTLRAEASVFPVLLDEIDKLRRYEYLCNEQLASKLKALLLEKKIRKYLGEPFKEDKNIKELIKKLEQNRRPEGTWGWWKNSDGLSWISLHVAEALLQAQKEGYAATVDKDMLYRYLLADMAGEQRIDQVHAVKLLYLLNEKFYLKDWVEAIEKKQKAAESLPGAAKQPLFDKLQLMWLKQLAGIKVDVNALLALKKSTMFGNSYWGTESNRFWDNSIQNTLLAYKILKANGGYRAELDQVLRYFLEQRKDGQWRNTYESSLILETILPELIVEGKKAEPVTLVLNKTEKVTAFPFNKVMEPQILTVEKKGDAPVYFTAFQQFNNPKPEKVSKEFTVKTWFDQEGTAVKNLKAGKSVHLQVDVEVKADADYVMIEIPIPAGCSYENKLQTFWGVETHREYFKHKTSIFCTKLKQGKYKFSIELMPRYSGNYVLNPAKAEMMYFPVFYGREGIRRVAVN